MLRHRWFLHTSSNVNKTACHHEGSDQKVNDHHRNKYLVAKFFKKSFFLPSECQDKGEKSDCASILRVKPWKKSAEPCAAVIEDRQIVVIKKTAGSSCLQNPGQCGSAASEK